MSMLVRVPLKPGVYIMMEREKAIRLGYLKAAQPVENKMVKAARNKGVNREKGARGGRDG